MSAAEWGLLLDIVTTDEAVDNALTRGDYATADALSA